MKTVVDDVGSKETREKVSFHFLVFQLNSLSIHFIAVPTLNSRVSGLRLLCLWFLVLGEHFCFGVLCNGVWHWHFISRAIFFFAHSNIGEQYSTIYICIAPFSECTVFRGFVTWFMIIRELECNQNSLIDISCPTATSPWLPKIVVDATHCLCISFEFVKAEKYHFSYSLLNLHDAFSLTAMSQVN